MSLVVSLLYLMLYICAVALCFALIVWLLRVLGIAIDPMVMNILKIIGAIIVVILIVSWLAGVLPGVGHFRIVSLAH
jgi:hypothetical protein